MINFRALFPDMEQSFKSSYRCYSVSLMRERERDVEKGGKIIMPTSALDKLTRTKIMYPMLFKLSNVEKNRHTHCGVLEFVADEGLVYLPYWMMKNLLLDEGTKLTVENVNLPVATFAKFQPQQTEFLDISNPKAVLENALRNFACLTVGDVVAIKYNDKIYELCVLETKPGPAVSIIECDMNVEFAPPVGYQEPHSMHKTSSDEEEDKDHEITSDSQQTAPQFCAFTGEGNRLDGKKKISDGQPVADQPAAHKRGVPNYDYKTGSITFIRTVRPSSENDQVMKFKFEAFSGTGEVLTKNVNIVE
ncbi:recognition factor in ER-associated degradation 1-like [Octopus vulgaris]|uniref:Recognition factor in ER-associated degradation 1-like n=4 Tax=Octopus TaxID=6643 RepID=A0AA36FD77_OCTVU|nr:recognition factor in ER-associated degradation 1-like [Octopus vulgaris]